MILDLRFIDDPVTNTRVLQALIVKKRTRVNQTDVPTLAVWTTVRYERYNAYDGQEVEFIGTYDPSVPSLRRDPVV